MLKLIVHHAPKLLVFVCGLHLHLSKPQWQHVIRLADALIVSDTRHKTIAGLYRLIVDAPEASNGADSLRISPWTADDLRAPLRLFTVTDLVAYANETNEWTLYVSLDDSLGEKDKDTRHLEAVAYHHDHTKSQGKKKPYQGHLVFQYNPDESQRLCRLGRQLAASRRDVGMPRPSQQANRGVA